jgi:hypothetical protein
MIPIELASACKKFGITSVWDANKDGVIDMKDVENIKERMALSASKKAVTAK